MEEPVMFDNSAPFQSDPTSADAADAASKYSQVNLVSNIDGLALKTDSHLVNPWGVSFREGPGTPGTFNSPFWISDQGSHSTTLYLVAGSDGTVVNNPVPVFTVDIPGGPTGQVSNPLNSASFKLTVTDPLNPAHDDHDPASFIFANLNGTISAWNSKLGTNGSTAHVEVTTPGAVYTGLAVN